jgi:hypothetical protein
VIVFMLISLAAAETTQGLLNAELQCRSLDHKVYMFNSLKMLGFILAASVNISGTRNVKQHIAVIFVLVPCVFYCFIQ